jgi:branched-chain amino acid transport system permease protein
VPFRNLGLAFSLAALALPLLPVPDYLVNIANMAGMAALVALGLVVLTGVGGMTSFAQAAFVGFGAYTTAVLTTAWGLSAWATLAPALLVTALGALVVGAVTVRLSGHFLALGTVAWAISFYFLFGNLPVLGQHTGISSIPPISIGVFDFANPRRFYLLVWLAVVGCTALTVNLLDSRSGRAVRALRGGSDVAKAFGVNANKAKLGLFVYAAVLAGLSGWLLAHFQRYISPSLFGVDAGIEYLLMAVLGGAGHVYGAIVGAAIVVVLREQLQVYLPQLLGQTGNFETVVFGAILLGVLLAAQEGLWPAIARWFPSKRATQVRKSVAMTRRSMPEERTELLAVEDLSKRFGGLIAVNNLSFSLAAGTITGLIGPNGAGKTTAFNLLTGVFGMTTGRIRMLGRDVSALTPQRAARLRIGRTFQHAKLIGSMSVLDNVAIGAHLRGAHGPLAAMLRLDRREDRQMLAEAASQIERVGLADVMHRPADSLSLGQLRLVEIARALALDPVLLLLDEPAAGLRYNEKVLLGNLLRQLRSEGMTVLIVEHDMDFVMNLVDQLVVLDFGTWIAEGSPAEVSRNPAVLAAYLGVQV